MSSITAHLTPSHCRHMAGAFGQLLHFILGFLYHTSRSTSVHPNTFKFTRLSYSVTPRFHSASWKHTIVWIWASYYTAAVVVATGPPTQQLQLSSQFFSGSIFTDAACPYLTPARFSFAHRMFSIIQHPYCTFASRSLKSTGCITDRRGVFYHW